MNMKTDNHHTRILFSGGGTLGSVMPLIAIIQELRRQSGSVADVMWVGTYGGVERAVIRAHNIEWRPIVSLKWRRYATWKNIRDVLLLPVACAHAWWIIRQFNPHVLISAGGYVSVPLHIVAWIKRIPTIVHHQDIETGLANKIMRMCASRTTATFAHTMKEFKDEQGILTGNPIREALRSGDKDRAIVRYKLDPELPTVLAFGGGTGAVSLNRLLADALPEVLPHAQVLHVTGQGKQIVVPFIRDNKHTKISDRYHAYEFFMDEEMADAYAVADVVVARAGLSTLSEIAALGKATIVVPIPHSHQEVNAEFFKSKQAVVVVEEKNGSAALARAMKHLLDDAADRMHIAQHAARMNDPSAHKKLVAVIYETAHMKNSTK